MKSKCSCCGKEFPMTELSFLPRAAAHIRHIVSGTPDAEVSDAEMHQLYCQDCLNKQTEQQ